jgi:alkylation response protein AidB-like acyl-CoA dehydrogenase
VNFDLDSDQRAAAAAARAFFTQEGSTAAARDALGNGDLRPGRRALAEVGYFGVTVPEPAGGAGRTVLDLAVIAEQAGAVLAGPSLVTAARAAVLLADAPDLAARLVDGSSAFAVVDGSPDGSRPSVDAADATVFLALDGDALVVGEGVATPGKPLDATRGLAAVRLTSRRVLVEDARALWLHARWVAAVVLAAEDLGSADRAVQLTVAYARERQAFGRPIASFQAVKHIVVDAWVAVEELRSLVWWAAWAADSAPYQLPLAAAAAKAHAAAAFERVAEAMIQVHGGIGVTWDHDAHLYWRRAKVDRLLLGDQGEHLDAVARLALAGALGD